MRSDTRDLPVAVAVRLALVLAMSVAAWSTPLRAQDNIPAPSDSIPAPTESIRRSVGPLRPGDELNIVVFRNAELTGTYLIDSRGLVQIPGLGTLRVAGLDPTQATERLQQALVARGFAAPEIAVRPLIRVGVLGRVATPGLHSVEPGTTLLQLLTIAGGPAEDANLSRARVVREGRVHVVNLQSALEGGAAGRIVLYSNDVVEIPERRGFTRENVAFWLGGLTALLTLVNVVVTLNR
jgi:protein involved in polysaccharide export with SLBB domain